MSKDNRRQYGSGSVFQRKNGLWVARLEVGTDRDGDRRRIEVSATTESRVKEKLEAKRIEVARMGAPDKTSGRNMTVAQWAPEWLAQRKDRLRPKPYSNAASNVKVWIVPTLGRKRLVDLTPADVRALMNKMSQADKAPSTMLHVHSDLMHMVKTAMIEGHAIPERVLLSPRPELGENDRQSLALSDAHAALKHAVERPDTAMWVAAFLEGLRQGERLGLTRELIDWDRDLIDVSWQLQPLPYNIPYDRDSGFRVPRNYVSRHLVDAYHLVRPKTKKGRRIIPLVPWFKQALADHLDAADENPYGLVWTTAGGRPIAADDDRAAWYDLQSEIGIHHPAGRPYQLHEIRHTTATLLRELNVPVEVVEAILGHAKFIESYDHSDQLRPARKALVKLAKKLELPSVA